MNNSALSGYVIVMGFGRFCTAKVCTTYNGGIKVVLVVFAGAPLTLDVIISGLSTSVDVVKG